jgi:hypothetical protein
MQIGSGLQSFAPQQNATSSDSPQQIGRAGAVGGGAQGAERSVASVPTQDSAVSISPQGAAAAARENASTGDASQASSGPAKSGAGDGSAAKSVSPSAPKPSSVKSFAYGSLGLERPDKPQENTNKAYSAGRWLAACATVWGILALIIA